MSMETAVHTLAEYLTEPLRVGEPDVAGPLAVYPLFGPEPRFEYRSFAQSCAHGVTIKELGEGASVRDLVVVNPTPVPVLLFEGEEVLGAQQNRTFDVSVLVPAGATVRVPVSCVEAHRWDGSRHDESFAPAPQAAYPTLRRLKNAAALRQVVAGAEARADQGAVWQEVDSRLDALAASAPTRAMHDGYEARRGELRELTDGCSVRPGQTGMLVAIGGELRVLDQVSRPDVLAGLFEPLVQGYALDALGVANTAPPSTDDARAFVERVIHQPILERDGIGLGRDVRVAADVTGAGLVCGDELIQLSVFAGDHDQSQTSVPVRIRRPSRRRS
jgi:hypothetical protein